MMMFFFKILFRFTLAVNKQIVITKIINDFYILSVTQDSVRLIEKIDNKETIDLLTIEGGRQEKLPNQFVDKLFGYLKTKGYKKEMVDNPLVTTQKLKDKIKKI